MAALWRCVDSACDGGAGATPADASTMCVAEMPPSGLSPLVLQCSQCSLRMVTCECCHVLLREDREVDGVLLCQRCGFLTIIDATLRGLVQLPPFSRLILRTLSPSVSSLDRLKLQWKDWEARVKAVQQRALSEGNGEAATPPGRHKKRRREISGDLDRCASSVDSEPVLPLTPTSGSSTMMPPELKAEGKRLQAEIHAAKRQWQRLTDEATREAASRDPQSLQHSLFSSTHLNILKIMYEKAMDKAELSDVTTQIEQFLVHQSAIVKAKYDLLAGIQACQQVRRLKSLALYKNGDNSQATRLMVHCAEEQVRQQTSEFDAAAHPFLRLVGIANKHLFALYNAAQSLAKMQTQQQDGHARDTTVVAGTHGLSPSILGRRDQPRKRRMFGSSSGTSASPNSSHSETMNDSVSLVQRSIEMRHRISEIAKKIELWRALSLTIASACVANLLELEQINHTESTSIRQ